MPDMPASRRSPAQEAEYLLLERARGALDDKDFDAFDRAVERLRPQVAGHATGPGPHEIYMDRWRLGLTAFLLAGLFVIVGVVALGTGDADATPYVSLLSGLAGIALGWAFANGQGNDHRAGE